MKQLAALLVFSLVFVVSGQTGQNPEALVKLKSLLHDGVKNGAYPGFVFVASKDGEVICREQGGLLSNETPKVKVTPASRYDLASLTKAVATTSAVMCLYEDGKLQLDDRISAFLPDFGQKGKNKLTIRQLLTHSSGLPAWAPLYKKNATEFNTPEEMIEKLMAIELAYEPGTKTVYSCLGFMVLQQAVEKIAGKRLDQLLQERVFGPLSMKNTGFNPAKHGTVENVAPTENCPVRHKLLQGEVHDENAWFLGGISGNAGLFSTAEDLGIFAQMMLNEGIYGGQRIFAAETIQAFSQAQVIDGEVSSRALGWEKPTKSNSAGQFFSSSAFGHTGFTGTALWIDPENGLFGIFLTNRVHPTRDNHKIYAFRSEVFNQLQLAVRPKIVVGAARTDQYLPKLKGKRVGLVVNQTAQVNGEHLIDLMLKNGVEVTTLFCPEHGIRGKALAGEQVDSSVDAKSGLPIISLYGKSRKPSAEDLKNVDVLVFDIQDVGVRFYTYISTMHYVMEAAAEHGKAVMILDRPNPNGDLVDGPILEEKWRSFVGMHPIPLVHGLTVGELALMIQGENFLKNDVILADFTVIPMENYRRDLPYSLPVKPSPNLATDLAVRLYPSLGLFEGTDLSVGRGTQTPFELIGFNDERAGEALGQVSDKGWPQRNNQIYGQRFGDLASFQVKSFDIGYFIDWYQKLKKLGYKDEQIITRREFLAKLMGTDTFYEQVINGWSEAQIRASWAAGLEAYKQMRAKYLLYP